MTVGEILALVASQYDNVEVEPHKWITIKFSCRTDTDGSVVWESPSAKYDEEQ